MISQLKKHFTEYNHLIVTPVAPISFGYCALKFAMNIRNYPEEVSGRRFFRKSTALI
mgnify:CR=1 FL=1